MNNLLIRADHILRGDIVSGQGQVVDVRTIKDVFENVQTGEIVGSTGVALEFISPVTGEAVFLRMPDHAMVEMVSVIRRGTNG